MWKKRTQLLSVCANHLQFMDKPMGTLWGGLSATDEAAVKELVKAASLLDGPIIEIGTLFGATAQLIAMEKPQEKQLITIDNYSWNPFSLSAADHAELTRRFLRCAVKFCNTRLFEGGAEEFYRGYTGGSPSMVFVDAEHTYDAVARDIKWAIQANVAIISGHDYCDNWPGVMKAVNEAFPKEQVQVKGSVWSWQRSTLRGSELGL